MADGEQPRISSNVVVRAWTPDLIQEGARFTATVVRRPITIRTRKAGAIESEDVTRDGIVVIGESGNIHGFDRAIDAVVRGIPDQIKLTIVSTPELLWLPVAATRDITSSWHIEAIPFVDWLRIVITETEPKGEK